MPIVPGWRELLPTAFLLAGSDPGARDLLARGLARGGGLDGLVRAHLRRRVGRDGVLVGTATAPWWVTPADAEAAARLALALDGLDRAERAAVVLRWFEDLPAAEVAARVPAVDLAALPDRLGVPAAELPARLEVLAGTAQPADLDDRAVAGAVRAVRARPRRVLLGAAAAAALVAAAVWLPHTVPSPAPPATATASAPQLAGPARGSLTGDRELVAALRARLDPTAGAARLVYAGDGVGHRWVLLVAQRADRADVHWFTGRRGAAAADLVETSLGYGGALPPAWSIAVTDEDGTTVMVVAADGDGVEVSSGVDVAPDGRVSRRFVGISALDGVVTVGLDRPYGTGARYRVVRGGAVVGTGSPVVPDDPGPPAPPAAAPRSGSGPVDPTAYGIAAGALTGPTGLDLDVVVLGAGSYPGPAGRARQAVTVAATLPGGAVVTGTAWATPDGSGQLCSTGVRPAGTDPAAVTVVSRCAADTGSSAAGDDLVVVAPPGAAVALTGRAGAAVVPDLDRGWAALADGGDDLATVAVDGVTAAVPPAGDDPLQGA